MTQRLMQRLHSEAGGPRRLTYALVAVLLCYAAVVLGSGATLAERVVLMRYASLFGIGLLAVSPPHLLFPDSQMLFLQQLNPRPAVLLGRQLRRWGWVVALAGAPLAVLAFYDPGGFGRTLPAKARALVEGLLAVGGIGAYSLAHYATVGRRSQAWQEGSVSAWYGFLKDYQTTGGFGVPDGLAPAVTASGRIFGAGVLVVAAGAYAGQLLAPMLAWVPGVLFGAWAAVKLVRLRGRYDRHFYQTNAFYREIFGRVGRVRGDGRAAVGYEAVYWTPRRWRPHVWAGLRQMDRRLPLGRLVALGHLLLWLLLFQQVGSSVLNTYLLLFIALQNGVCYVLATRRAAPPAFQHGLQAPGHWLVTRFFVNLRWAPPFAISLLLAAALAGAFSYAAALAWIGLDVFLALTAAAFITYFSEYRFAAHE